MKKDETAKAIKAKVKKDAFAEMVGSMFTADAKETEATAKKTAKTAVNGLNRLSPARLICSFFVRAISPEACTAKDWLAMDMLAAEELVFVCTGITVAMFVFRLSR